jgi:hypothetical protein
VQLAELLDVSQQTITACEVGRGRIQVSSLPVIAQEFIVADEQLLGQPTPAAAGKRGPAPKLQQQMDLHRPSLHRAQQRFVMQVLESVLARTGRLGWCKSTTPRCSPAPLRPCHSLA